jgi:hypothetical protein
MTSVGALVSVFGRFSVNKLAKFCTSSLLMKMASLLPRFKKKKKLKSGVAARPILLTSRAGRRRRRRSLAVA